MKVGLLLLAFFAFDLSRSYAQIIVRSSSDSFYYPCSRGDESLSIRHMSINNVDMMEVAMRVRVHCSPRNPFPPDGPIPPEGPTFSYSSYLVFDEIQRCGSDFCFDTEVVAYDLDGVIELAPSVSLEARGGFTIHRIFEYWVDMVIAL